ncbi:MAG: MFS transporter [Chitinophagales bacterium]
MKNSRAIWLLLLANSISGVAQGISMLAVPWYFTGIIHREELFGNLYLLVTAISLLWGLYAGSIIDRHDRRRIFLAINLSGFAVLAVVTGIGFSSHYLPWFLVASVFATTSFIYNIHFPNLYAFAQEITPREQYGRVTSLLEIQGQLAFTVAGGLAAILMKGINQNINLFGWDVHLPFTVKPWAIYEIFAINALTYIVAFLIISRIKSMSVVEKKIDTGSIVQRVKTGVQFLRRNTLIFHFGNITLLLFLTILVFGTYVMTVYVNSFLQRGGDVYAFGDMAFSFGSLLAGFLTTRVFGEKNVVRGIIILTAVAGIMYCVMTLRIHLVWFFVAQLIIGASNAAVRIQRITYLFHHIPNHVIGRANSIFFVISVFLRMCLIALFTLPFFHRGGNIVYAVGIMAVICFAGAAILLLNYKRLVHLREVQ